MVCLRYVFILYLGATYGVYQWDATSIEAFFTVFGHHPKSMDGPSHARILCFQLSIRYPRSAYI